MFSFCKPVSSKKRFLPFRELDENFSFSLFENAASIPAADWASVLKGQSIFLEPGYLKIVETGTHTRLTSRYVVVYNQQQPCGIIYFQIADFKAGIFEDLFSGQPDTLKSKRLKIFENYLGANKDEILMRLFTCGNNLVSGEHGYVFNQNINKEQAHALLLKITEVVSKEEKLRGSISAILLKDFHLPLEPADLFEEEKYSRFFVEPNLIVEIPPAVHSITDYIELFSKKYRNRARSIFKSLDGVTLKTLSADDIKQNEEKIFALYEEVFEKAKFKLIKLPHDYFSKVKAVFGSHFTVQGFFMEGEMIAFCSSLLMPDGSVEAHYIGFKYALNQQFNLYQNILYTIIGEAIANQRTKVNLGRTAAEIKTTVGAKPYDLLCYIKPQNTISKLIQKPFISFLQPPEWTPRNPFKEEGVEKSSDNMPAGRS